MVCKNRKKSDERGKMKVEEDGRRRTVDKEGYFRNRLNNEWPRMTGEAPVTIE
jgi:hypothetical protein